MVTMYQNYAKILEPEFIVADFQEAPIRLKKNKKEKQALSGCFCKLLVWH